MASDEMPCTRARLELLESPPINLQPNNPHQHRSAQCHATSIEDSGMIRLERAVLASICSEEVSRDRGPLFYQPKVRSAGKAFGEREAARAEIKHRLTNK
jgi:hypothetical protein